VGALAQARLVLNKGDSMARRNQGINVKVPRVKVIKALEQALVKLETIYKTQDKNQKQFDAALVRWQKQVQVIAISKFNKAENLRVNVRYNGVVNVDFDLPASAIKIPKEPERGFEVIPDWQYKENKEEIENAIRVLKMCDDELISTATYGGITKYL
jgi:hypothetical protein